MSKLLSIVLLVVVFAGCKTTTSPSEPTLPHTAKQRISGTVKDASTDALISGASVTLSKPDTMSTMSDATGYFKFDSVPAGVYTVFATAAGYGNDQTTIRLDSGVNASVTLRPAKNSVTGTGNLQLHVVDSETGAPIPYAVIGFLVNKDSASVITFANLNGDFDTTLPAGTYSMATGDTSRSSTRHNDTYFDVTITKNQTTTQTIRLSKYIYVPPPPHDTLICQYRFNGNVLDSAGFGHDATKHGCTYVPDRFGNPNSALQLNGTTDYISIPDAADLNFGKSENFSISFWVHNPSSTYDGYLVRKATGKGSAITGYDVLLNGTSIVAEVGTTYGALNTGYNERLPGDTRWHFVVVTFDRQQGIFINIDNSNGSTGVGSSNALAGNMDISAPLVIGGDGTSTNAYKGIIDDVRIHKGILRWSDINLLYHENGW